MCGCLVMDMRQTYRYAKLHRTCISVDQNFIISIIYYSKEYPWEEYLRGC